MKRLAGAHIPDRQFLTRELLFGLKLITLLLLGMPSSANAQPKADFVDGLTPPKVLLPMGNGMARGQTFRAHEEEILELQLSVARVADTINSPLEVEIRSPDLARRFGQGFIAPIKGSLRVPKWHTVEWKQKPKLSPDERYTIVLIASQYPAWAIASGPSSLYGPTDQKSYLGFRIKFTSGAILNSEFVLGDEPIQDIKWNGRNKSTHGELRIQPSGRHQEGDLPQCVGNRCADFR